jgi:hypothetical protein
MAGKRFNSGEALDMDLEELQLTPIEDSNPFKKEPAYPTVFLSQVETDPVISLQAMRKIQQLQSNIETLKKEITDKLLSGIDDLALKTDTPFDNI